MENDQFIKKLKEANNLIEIQSKNITDEYMKGLYNGMELILSIFESREPIYWSKKRQKMIISLCKNCYCMTHTINGKCGKCGARKEK